MNRHTFESADDFKTKGKGIHLLSAIHFKIIVYINMVIYFNV